MNHRQTRVTLVVALLCSGILVLFTNVELDLLRWLNCGSLSSHQEQRSNRCR
ncbi:MAG: hypothetical protein VKK03_09795 [Synechococcus sp.]|nr:hypothetical protein [Synechococcus sp.]